MPSRTLIGLAALAYSCAAMNTSCAGIADPNFPADARASCCAKVQANCTQTPPQIFASAGSMSTAGLRPMGLQYLKRMAVLMTSGYDALTPFVGAISSSIDTGAYELCTKPHGFVQSTSLLDDAPVDDAGQHWCGVQLTMLGSVGLCVPKTCGAHDLDVLMYCQHMDSGDDLMKFAGALAVAGKLDLAGTVAQLGGLSYGAAWDGSSYCADDFDRVASAARPGFAATVMILVMLAALALVGTLVDVALAWRRAAGERTKPLPPPQFEAAEGQATQRAELEEVLLADEPVLVGGGARAAAAAPPPRALAAFANIFSLRSTYAELFTARQVGTLGTLNGVRVLSMMGVVLGHVVLFTIAAPATSNKHSLFIGYLKSFDVTIVYFCYFAVDAFFLLSGFLMAFVVLKKFAKKYACHGHANAARAAAPGLADGPRPPGAGACAAAAGALTLHRYLRLTPIVALAILCSIFLVPLAGDGPFWAPYATGFSPHGGVDNCHTDWWYVLLYVNNIFPTNDNGEPGQANCIGWTWYLGCEMQLFVFTLVSLVLYLRTRFGAIVWLVAGLLITSLWCGILSHKHGMEPSIMAGDASKLLYNFPWTRGAPFFVGALLGMHWFEREAARTARKARDEDHDQARGSVALGGDSSPHSADAAYSALDGATLDDEDGFAGAPTSRTERAALTLLRGEFMPEPGVMVMYVACAGLLLATWLLPWTFIKDSAAFGGGAGWTREQIDWYHALMWPGFAFGLAGLVHMLISGRAPAPLAAFLSAPAFDWLAKLSFGAYIWHFMVMNVLHASFSSDIALNRWLLVALTLAVAFTAFGLSFGSYMLLESPFARLENKLLARLR